MADVRVGIDIEARDRATAQIGRARQELERYTAEINKLKRFSYSGADRSREIGEAMLRQSEAARRLQKSMAEASELGVTPFKRAIEGANEELVRHSGVLGGVVSRLGIVGTAVGVVAAGFAALGVALLAGARSIASYQEQLDLASESTGLTTGQLAGLRVAASESGRSFDQIRPALEFFTKKVGEAATGNEQAIEAFRGLGIGVRDAGGQIRPTGDVLKDVQQRLEGISSPAERAKVAMELFGRSGASAINVLLSPLDEAEAKARRLGLALGPEAEAAARRADAAFDALGTSLQGIGNAFGVVAAKITGPFLDSVAKASASVAEFANSPSWNRLFRSLSRLASPWALGTGTLLDIEDRTRVTPLGDFTLRRTGTAPGTGGAGGVVPEKVDEANKKIQEQIAAIEKAVAAGRLQADDAIKRLNALTEEKEAWNAITRIMEEQNRLLERRGGLVTGPSVREAERQARSSQNVLEGDLSVKSSLEPTTKSAEDFAAALQAAKKGMDEITYRLNESTAAAEEVAAAEAEASARTKAFARDVIQSVGSAFSSLVQTMLDGTRDINDAFEDMLKRILGDIIDAGIRTGLGALFPGLGFQAGGTVLAQAGGTYGFDNFHPLKAQSGLVVAGVRGIDTVPARLGRGETVLDHSLTDQLRQFLSEVKREMSTQPQAAASGPTANVTFNINDSGFLSDRGRRLQILRDDIVPDLRRVLERGARA